MLSANAEHPQSVYARALFDVVILKAQTILKIRSAYAQKDLSALREVSQKDIPELIGLYEKLQAIHRKQWLASYKRNGWEQFPLRYGAVIGRAKDVALALLEYADGKIDRIDELEAPMLDPTRKGGMQYYEVYVSPKL